MEQHFDVLFFAMCVAIVVARMLRAAFKFLHKMLSGCLWLVILAILIITAAAVL